MPQAEKNAIWIYGVHLRNIILLKQKKKNVFKNFNCIQVVDIIELCEIAAFTITYYFTQYKNVDILTTWQYYEYWEIQDVSNRYRGFYCNIIVYVYERDESNLCGMYSMFFD